jgi:hypothetical protein
MSESANGSEALSNGEIVTDFDAALSLPANSIGDQGLDGTVWANEFEGLVTASSGRSAAEDRGGGKICSAATARRLALSPAGEILPADRLAAAPAGSRA